LPPSLNYDSPRELRAFLDERGLGMRKKHGQNFLINPAARCKLLDALELRPGDSVWEIGPGLGAMTAGLLQRGAQVTAFEIDPAFASALREFFSPEDDNNNPSEKFTTNLTNTHLRCCHEQKSSEQSTSSCRSCGSWLENPGTGPAFRLVEGDVLKTWPDAGEPPLFLFGNLPYNIAAALLADFIEKGRFFSRMVVTVQREVARRMAAKPGSADYSSFSVLCSSVYKVTPLSVIKPSSFYPAPRVDSQGVRLDFDSGREKLPRLFYPLVRGLFSSRRKTIKNTLSAFAASVIMKHRPGAEIAPEVLRRAGISGERRPETLCIKEFAALAAILEEIVSDGN